MKAFIVILLLSAVFAEEKIDSNIANNQTNYFDLSQINGVGSINKCLNVENECLIDLCDGYKSIIADDTTIEVKMEFNIVQACVAKIFDIQTQSKETFSGFVESEIQACNNENEEYEKFLAIYLSTACTTYFTSVIAKEQQLAPEQVQINVEVPTGFDLTACGEKIEEAKKALTEVQLTEYATFSACIEEKTEEGKQCTITSIQTCIEVYKTTTNFVQEMVDVHLGGSCLNLSNEVSEEEIKSLSFQDLFAQTSNLNQSTGTQQAVFEAIQQKIDSESDNPCLTAEGSQQVLKMVEELGNTPSNETAAVHEVLETFETSLKENLANDESGEFCATAQQYLLVSEKLMINSEEGSNGTYKANVGNATNLYIQCANFLTGQENLQLTYSNVSMKTFNPSAATQVNITSGSNSINLNENMLNKVKDLANMGDSDELVVTMTTYNKGSAGLSSISTQNVTAKEIVIAEFKKKTSSGVEDIIVGSLADNVTLAVQFSESVNTSENFCARYENGAWVESGSFAESSNGLSNVCQMNHASEYSIVATQTEDAEVSTEFASKFNLSILLGLLIVLLL